MPFGRGRSFGSNLPKALNVVLGGWSASAIPNYFSGTPLTFPGSVALSGGWNGATNRANIAPGNLLSSSFHKSAFQLASPNSPNNTYLNKALFSDPAPLTLGTAARQYAQARNFGVITKTWG